MEKIRKQLKIKYDITENIRTVLRKRQTNED
jgi:hypothetical protein